MKSIDQLDKAVTETVKDAAGKTMTKDQLITVIDDTTAYLSNVNSFLSIINQGEVGPKLKAYLDQNARSNLESIKIYNQINGQLMSAAKKSMESKFLGAFQDTLSGLYLVLNQTIDNIDQLFADKNITIYNTKISHVAVYGMLQSARVFAQFVTDYIALFMSDRSETLFKPAKYTLDSLKAHVTEVTDTINRTLGGQLDKSFVQAIKKYHASGADIGVVNTDSKSTVQFAKINNEVTDGDIKAGAKGLAIFRIIGDWFVSLADAKRRKLIAERDQLDARAQLLQLELNGVAQDSPEYKKYATIIKNYQALIDRLNAKIAKYEND
jgi:hypothetical protein